jgi:hypothetical protein
VIATWAAFLSTGGALAPVLGGLTGNYGSWRWSFVVVAILGAVSAVLSLFLARDSKSPAGRSLDFGGQVTIGVSLFALLYAVIQGESDGWGATGVVTGFVVAAVFFVLFILAERRATSPLLRLELFKNRNFSVAAIVAVVGMFAFLGTAYATSIRVGVIQHQSPLRTCVPFLLLNGLALVLTPLTSRLLAHMPARWLLGLGLALMGVGDFVAATLSVDDTAIPSLIVPLGLVGIGFAFAVSSITATAVNTVPHTLEGMASGATNQLRDFGFTLGPAVVGAIALSQAAGKFTNDLASSNLSAASKAAASAVAKAGGPTAVNSLDPTTTEGAAAPLAMRALGSAYSLGYVVCGCAALAAALLVALAMGRKPAS